MKGLSWVVVVVVIVELTVMECVLGEEELMEGVVAMCRG